MKIHEVLERIWEEGFPGKESFQDVTGFDLYVDCYQQKLVEHPIPGKTLKLGFYITLSELDLEEDFAREIRWMKKSQGKFDFNSEDVQVGDLPLEYFKNVPEEYKKEILGQVSLLFLGLSDYYNFNIKIKLTLTVLSLMGKNISTNLIHFITMNLLFYQIQKVKNLKFLEASIEQRLLQR